MSSTAPSKLGLLELGREDIRVLHWTWIAFFITFYVWFNMAPLATTMLKSIDWMTKDHIKVLAICNVALTIPGRIVIGALIDRFGPRIVFSILMVTMAIPAFFFAFGTTFVQLMVSRLVLSVIGAGFVIGIRMVAQWFPPKVIGRAEGFYAGWGNFGSAAAAMTLPWIALSVFGSFEDGWRYALAFNGGISFIYGIVYYFLVTDIPRDGATKAYHFVKAKKAQPMEVSSWLDLIQYLVWSFPLIGALGILAWRIGNVVINKGTPEAMPLISPAVVYIIYALLALIYIAHVLKTLQVNLPVLRAGVPESEKYHWGSVAALNSTYFANFGAELAVVSMLPMFFQNVFSMTPTSAGMIAASFAVVNLFARPLGGFISDHMNSRKLTMMVYMVGIAIGFFLMALIGKYGPEGSIIPQFEGMWWLIIAVVITISCSVFVQGAEGATFAVIPMIKKSQTGQIAGMAGAYGNVGAVVYLVIYSMVDSKTFFYIIALGAAISFLFCLFILREPEGAFADE
ncbi:MAG: MFS transporter [Deltaproteobacteria bacterium]|nr:MFS transporter [Deltaproteobacteria bacterium]